MTNEHTYLDTIEHWKDVPATERGDGKRVAEIRGELDMRPQLVRGHDYSKMMELLDAISARDDTIAEQAAEIAELRAAGNARSDADQKAREEVWERHGS